MNNDSDTDRIYSIELSPALLDALRRFGDSLKEITDSFAAFEFQYDKYDDISVERSPELDEFLSGFRVTAKPIETTGR